MDVSAFGHALQEDDSLRICLRGMSSRGSLSLNDVEKNKARELVKLNVPPKDLRREMIRLTGKCVIMQDIHNIKKTVRQTEKEAASNGNDAQMLAVAW